MVVAPAWCSVEPVLETSGRRPDATVCPVLKSYATVHFSSGRDTFSRSAAQTKFILHILNLFYDKSNLFGHRSNLFGPKVNLFCDGSNLFYDEPNLFCHGSNLFCGKANLFCFRSNLFYRKANLFFGKPNVFYDRSNLFGDGSNGFFIPMNRGATRPKRRRNQKHRK
jgi:hypothetical protein